MALPKFMWGSYLPESPREAGANVRENIERTMQAKRNVEDVVGGAIDATGRAIAYPFKEFAAGYSPSAAAPAATQNAVHVPTEGGADRGVNATMQATPTGLATTVPTAQEASTAATPAGQVSRIASNADQPYPGGTTPSATPPVDIANQIAGMGSAGIDFGLPRMGYQPAAAPTGGGGLFPPGLMNSIQQYHDLAAKADDGSLAGAWRSRGYAKQRDRLLAGAVAAAGAEAGAITAGAHVTGANAAMMRAVNEPALEAMKNYVATRGQNLTYGLGVQQDLTHRYGYDVTRANALDTAAAHRYAAEQTAGAHKYTTDVDYLKSLPDVQRKDLALQAFQAGDIDKANVLLGHPQQERYTQAGGPLEGGVRILDQRSGTFSYIPTKDLPKFTTQSQAMKEARKKHIEDVTAGQ